MARVMKGAIRASAHASRRRGGFRIGPEPIVFGLGQMTAEQLLQMLDDPLVTVELAIDDDGTFVRLDAERGADLRRELGVLRPPVRDLGTDRALGRAASAFALDRTAADLVASAAAAEGAISAAVPGRGAGAEHPATHASAPVAQREVDPNPALPAGGGASDLGVEVAAPVTDATIVDAGLNGATDPLAEVMVDGAPREQAAVVEDIQALDGLAPEPDPALRIDPAAQVPVEPEPAEAGWDKVLPPAADTVEAGGVVAAPSVEAAVGEPVVDAGQAVTAGDPEPPAVATESRRSKRGHR